MLGKMMLSAATIAVAAFVAAGPALSADKPFYKGKRITFLGNSRPVARTVRRDVFSPTISRSISRVSQGYFFAIWVVRAVWSRQTFLPRRPGLTG